MKTTSKRLNSWTNSEYTFPLIQLGWEYPAFLVGMKIQHRSNYSARIMNSLKAGQFVGFTEGKHGRLLGYGVLEEKPRVESTLLCDAGDYLREGYGALDAMDVQRVTPNTSLSPPSVWTARHQHPAWLYVVRWSDAGLSPDGDIMARQWQRRLRASEYLEGLSTLGLDHTVR
jgi:hypothetical protein